MTDTSPERMQQIVDEVEHLGPAYFYAADMIRDLLAKVAELKQYAADPEQAELKAATHRIAELEKRDDLATERISSLEAFNNGKTEQIALLKARMRELETRLEARLKQRPKSGETK